MLGIDAAEVSSHRAPWNKGRLIGQKRPLKPKEVWAIRVRLQLEERRRDLALFNLALDSKLRGCDLVRLQVNDVCVGGRVRDRATVIQRKTGRPVQFEITEQTRAAIRDWVANSVPGNGQYLFPSRFHDQPHISTRQYARIVHRWVERAGLDSSAYGTHSMRRTKAAQIYKKTGNLRAVQLLLGHTKLESTVRYLRWVERADLDSSAYGTREAVIRFPTVEPERAQNHTSDADSDARCERTQLDVSRPRSIKIQFECELVHTSPSRIGFLIFVRCPSRIACTVRLRRLSKQAAQN